MKKDDELQEKLIKKVKSRRLRLHAFVTDLERRSTRLTNVSIICTSVTAVLTAGPTFGGEKFTEGMQALLHLASDSYVWRTLCLAAVILSITAAIANNMYRSHDMASRLAKAEASAVLLEGLETSIEFGQLSIEEATKQFQHYLADVPFVQEI